MRAGFGFGRAAVAAGLLGMLAGCGGSSSTDTGVPMDVPGDVPPTEDTPVQDPGGKPDVVPAHCSNLAQDGDESDIDCGGSCTGCTFKQKCNGSGDCSTSWCVKNLCNVPTCEDELQGPTEIDVDCGGTCGPCADGLKCFAMSDCVSGLCVLGVCLAPTCEDLHKNGNESDIDCGGVKCNACANGQACRGPIDCASGRCISNYCMACSKVADCPGEDQPCEVRTCEGGACGHLTIAAGDPASIQVAGDCQKLLCKADGTTETANDDGDLADDKNDCTTDSCDAGVPGHELVEEGADCATAGGKKCDATGKCVACLVDDDCASLVCSGNKCSPATCKDLKKNGNETDVDCGGACGDCGTDQGCKIDADCASGACVALVCAADTCEDGRKNGEETAVDCGGTKCPGCPVDVACLKNTDCLSGHCLYSVCVQCVLPTDCPGTDDECTTRTCDYSNLCGVTNADFGTVPATQVAGDCFTIICDGQGGSSLMVEDKDLPVDGKECTLDVCSKGVPSNPPAPPGTPCTENGGTKCDDAGVCVP